MSIELTFSQIQILLQQELKNQQSHFFQLEIFNKEHRQNMKFRFHSINDGWVDLPKNYFVVTQGSTVSFRVQERNQGKELDRMLSFGEFQFGLGGLELEADGIIKESKLTFETFNKKFKMTIAFKYRYLKNKIFSGYFYGLLKNQGYETLSLISMNESQIKINDHPERQFLKQAPATVTIQSETTQSKTKSKWSFKNCFSVCNQAEAESEQVEIAQEEIPKQFEEKINSKSMTPKTKTMVELHNQESEKIHETKLSSTEKKQQLNQSEVKKELVSFFKGPCKSKNIFSCADTSVDQQEICIIQPVYR